MSIRRGNGPFAQRPFFTDTEIERIAAEELSGAGLMPSAPGAIRIERFVEKRFGLSAVRYEALPAGVLGYTQFGSGGVESITVSRQLSEEGSRVAERRINTTLAHEAGHGLLHAHLFALEQFPDSLFEKATEVTPERILCRDDFDPARPSRTYDGRWWEFQANRMIGALLLPELLVYTVLERVQVTEGALGLHTLPKERWQEATRLLSDVFDVNPIAAGIRLQQLFGSADAQQLTL